MRASHLTRYVLTRTTGPSLAAFLSVASFFGCRKSSKPGSARTLSTRLSHRVAKRRCSFAMSSNDNSLKCSVLTLTPRLLAFSKATATWDSSSASLGWISESESTGERSLCNCPQTIARPISSHSSAVSASPNASAYAAASLTI